jgi:predicted enzyme related to lactoylglutathione lyase
MTDPNFILLYVEDAARSAAFYQSLLGKAPAEASPTFAMFPLDSGVMLGLWGAFAVADDATVSARHKEWAAQGLTILQEPQRMDFGFTFTAADPDGHRLRVFSPAM